LQVGDIVTIIKNNGVNFKLTPVIKRELIAAGARPAVIRAVVNNPRMRRMNKPAQPTYNDLIDQALDSYKKQGKRENSVRILEKAITAQPENPVAYQMLGYIYLYAFNNFAQAEKSMLVSIAKGGSAVFRVFHDDNGKFTATCTGSLYISRDTVRFESDSNVHTFEVSMSNVAQMKIDTMAATPKWKEHSIYKIILRTGKSRSKFRFAPLTGALEESKMVERLIRKK